MFRHMQKKLKTEYHRRKIRRGQFLDPDYWFTLSLSGTLPEYEHILFDSKFNELSQALFQEKKTSLTVREMWNLHNWVTRTSAVPGNIAEVGVFKGGSAKLISEVKGERKLYLFDTFEGLPPSNFAVNNIKAGEIKGDTMAEVQAYLAPYSNLLFYKGIFPDTAISLQKASDTFSLVHLDTDLYESTLDALSFFYPLLSPQGVIITHDYRSAHLPGVKKAFDAFFTDKPETIVELWDTQAMVIKAAS